jgi:hypothetical protein
MFHEASWLLLLKLPTCQDVKDHKRDCFEGPSNLSPLHPINKNYQINKTKDDTQYIEYLMIVVTKQ